MKHCKNCKNCKKEIVKKSNESSNYFKTKKYCSPRCGSIGKKNKLGKTGYKHTIKARKAIGKASRGEKNIWWRGGKSTLERRIMNMFEHKLWRHDVLHRDKYACRNCGDKRKVETHHIKAFKKIMQDNKITTTDEARECLELWNVNNGLTLCRKCHTKTDNYGNKSI